MNDTVRTPGDEDFLCGCAWRGQTRAAVLKLDRLSISVCMRVHDARVSLHNIRRQRLLQAFPVPGAEKLQKL